MKKRLKTAAAALALMMLGGAIPGGFTLPAPAVTAHAADGYANLEGDTLHIGGAITKELLHEHWADASITKIVADEGCVLPNSSSELFYGYDGYYSYDHNDSPENDFWVNLKSIDLSNADSSNVEYMGNMFACCANLETITFGDDFDTSKVESMGQMFYCCYSLKELDLSTFDTSNITSLVGMFRQCHSLKELDLSSFDTAKVTNMECLFLDCEKLETITFGPAFDTSHVTNMIEVFDYCESLKELDLSGFDTSQVENMNKMFRHCKSLTELDLSTFDTSKVTDMQCMFQDCKNLEKIIVSPLWSMESTNPEDWWYAEGKAMFIGCEKLVGGNGTAYSPEHYECDYACIDGENGQPGYFTLGYPGNYIKGASIALSGWIGVSFYTLPQSNTAKAVLSGPNGDVTITDFETETRNCHPAKVGNEGVELIYYVNVLQPDKDISLRFYDANGKQLDILNSNFEKQENKVIKYSVTRYINDAQQYIPQQYSSEKKRARLLNLLNALDNYCKAARNYFKDTNFTVNGIENVTAEDFDEYHPTLLGNRIALELDSGTTIRIYSNAKVANNSELQNTNGHLPKNSAGYFEMLDIPAFYLDRFYEVEIGNPLDTHLDKMRLCALSYGYLAMQLEPGTRIYEALDGEDLQVLAKAMYIYAKAAKAAAAR